MNKAARYDSICANKDTKLRSSSPDETGEIGMALGKCLKPGDVIGLYGGLGSGKTVFASGMARSLGVEEKVTSPTFCIVNEYTGRMPVYHFDVYRIDDPEDMVETGYYDYVGGNGVIIIEWPERIAGVLPKEIIKVSLCAPDMEAPDLRSISIEWPKGRRQEV